MSNFPELRIFIDVWALPNEQLRSEQRWRATPEEFRAFYSATLKRLDELLDTLDQYELEAIPEPALPLYRLALAFAEAAPHCELYGDSAEVPNSFEAHRFIAAHGLRTDE